MFEASGIYFEHRGLSRTLEPCLVRFSFCLSLPLIFWGDPLLEAQRAVKGPLSAPPRRGSSVLSRGWRGQPGFPTFSTATHSPGPTPSFPPRLRKSWGGHLLPDTVQRVQPGRQGGECQWEGPLGHPCRGSCWGAQKDRSPWGCLAPTHSQVACLAAASKPGSENSRGEWEGGKQILGHCLPPEPSQPPRGPALPPCAWLYALGLVSSWWERALRPEAGLPPSAEKLWKQGMCAPL